MTIEETLKIMSMLSAYYGQPKGDAQQMAGAWHLILEDYEYHDAEIAVVEFAKNDIRDYNVFPTAGKFVQSIDKVKNMPYRIIGKIRNGVPYEQFDSIERKLFSEEAYNRAVAMGEIKLLDDIDTVVDYIRGRQERLLVTLKTD